MRETEPMAHVKAMVGKSYGFALSLLLMVVKALEDLTT